MRIALIGAGISGIVAARVLGRLGHDVTVYESSGSIGGVWATAYPGVRLQNVAEHYRVSDFPWPFDVDLHPTAEQILRYLEAIVESSQIDVRVCHRVVSMRRDGDAWELDVESDDTHEVVTADFVVVATGMYGNQRVRLPLPGEEEFRGKILTEREVGDYTSYASNDVVVVGFGKTALDLACFLLDHQARVHLVFRTPRWLLPQQILGRHMAEVVTARAGTVIPPSWVYPSRLDAWFHRIGPLIRSQLLISSIVMDRATRLSARARDGAARARLRLLKPEDDIAAQVRGTIAPAAFYQAVADGRIQPWRGQPAGYEADALVLADGRRIQCSSVIFALGSRPPAFPFLPAVERSKLMAADDGAQLYRHLVHPDLPGLAFAGYNHSFFHTTGVELGMLWLGASLNGDLVMPTRDAMIASIARVQKWKRAHLAFEPVRGFLISGAYHRYFDVLVGDLGLRTRRKSSLLADWFEPYAPADYASIYSEYATAQDANFYPRRPLALDT